MIERRGGNFDLSLCGELGVDGQHHAHHLRLLAAQHLLVFDRIVAALRHKPADVPILRKKFLVKPGQLGKHLQIAEALCAKTLARSGDIRSGRLPKVVQLAIARIPVDHPRQIRLKEILQYERLFALGEILGWFERCAQKRIVRVPGCIILNLHHHGRHQIESLVNGGEILQHFHHAVVILQTVHAGPREFILAGNQILIKRLVHVPDKAEVDVLHESF